MCAVLSTLPLHAACSSCAELQSWLQQLVLIRAITHASVAEAELAINSVTMTDRMGASSPLRRALAAVLVAALSRRLNARGPSCFRQLSIISKNLAGALQASRAAPCGTPAGRAPPAAGGLGGGLGLGGGSRNPIHLPTTTSAPATRSSKSVLGAGLVRAMEASGEEEEEEARAELCRMACVSGIAMVLLHWAPILQQAHTGAAGIASGSDGGGGGGSCAGGDHVTLESAFLVTGLRVLFEEVAADSHGAPALTSALRLSNVLFSSLSLLLLLSHLPFLSLPRSLSVPLSPSLSLSLPSRSLAVSLSRSLMYTCLCFGTCSTHRSAA